MDDLELRRKLLDWRARREYFEYVADFTEDYTDSFNDYLIGQGIAGALPLHPTGSAFSPDPERLVRDPVFESQLVHLKVIVSRWVTTLGPELSTSVGEMAAYVDSLRAVR